MRRWSGWFGLGLLLILSGCVPSLHPLYTEEDLIFDPALVGGWAEENSKETWTFTKSDEKEYQVVYVDDQGRKGEFDVHLLKLKGVLFLDFYPAEPQCEENGFYQAHKVPVHTFMKVEQIEPTLRMAALNPDGIKRYLQEHPRAIKHEKVEDAVILTAQPKKLQAFLLKLDKKEGTWGDFSDLTKKTKQ